MWEVLGGLFGHERIGRKQYLKLFFMTFETKAPTHVQTAWYSNAVRAPRRQATARPQRQRLVTGSVAADRRRRLGGR